MSQAKIISLHCALIRDLCLRSINKKEFDSANIIDVEFDFEKENNKIIVYCDNDTYDNIAFYYNYEYACYISKKHIIRDTGHTAFYSFIRLL